MCVKLSLLLINLAWLPRGLLMHYDQPVSWYAVAFVVIMTTKECSYEHSFV